VKPKVGGATFFSYRGKDGKMDDAGYTEHSGCPILEGTYVNNKTYDVI